MTAEYMQRYREKRKEYALNYLGNKCARCGSIQKLQIDHIDPQTKLFNVSGYTGSKHNFLAELEKCQLLCTNCHKQKTKAESAVVRECGTVAKYRHDGCRCSNCVEVMQSSRQRWNLKYRGRI